MTYAELLPAINAGHRDPAGCTPPVCAAYNGAADDEGRLLVNAVLGFEAGAGRKARTEDGAAIMAKRDQLRAALQHPMARVGG